MQMWCRFSPYRWAHHLSIIRSDSINDCGVVWDGWDGGGGVVRYFQIAIAESLSVFDYLQLKIN